MNKKLLFLGPIILFTSFGCSRVSEPPPTERNRLVTGFFSSLSSGDINAAAFQGQKLFALNPHNDFVLRLVNIQKSNVVLQQAQAHINSGNIRVALKLLETAYKQNPGNRELRTSINKVRQLRNAKKLLTAMAKASSSAAMRSALVSASTGLSQNITPELREYFREYEENIKAVVEKEKNSAPKADIIKIPNKKV